MRMSQKDYQTKCLVCIYITALSVRFHNHCNVSSITFRSKMNWVNRNTILGQWVHCWPGNPYSQPYLGTNSSACFTFVETSQSNFNCRCHELTTAHPVVWINSELILVLGGDFMILFLFPKTNLLKQLQTLTNENQSKTLLVEFSDFPPWEQGFSGGPGFPGIHCRPGWLISQKEVCLLPEWYCD